MSSSRRDDYSRGRDRSYHDKGNRYNSGRDNYRSGGGSSYNNNSSWGGGNQGSWGGNQGGYNSNNRGGMSAGGFGNKPKDTMGSKLFDIDWSRERLDPFNKAFYKEGQSKRQSDEIDQYRKDKEVLIKESYSKVPNPFISWDETFFPPYIMKEINNAGFKSPTAIQAQAFPIIMSGHDFIGIAKTGSGKTLSFLLPSVVHINAQPPVKKGDGPIVLVLTPTRELAVQIQDEVTKFGASSQLKSVCVYGGQDKYKQLEPLRNGADILIATPGRLIDFLEKRETNLRRVTYLCLDEADRMLDMGFEHQIRKILGQIRPDRQTVMFSATWPKEVQGLAKDFCQEEPIYIQIGNYSNTVNTDIRQIIEVLGQAQKNERLVKYLLSMKSSDKVLIFTQTKKDCEKVAQHLRYERFPAIPIHGDKSQDERDSAIEAFRNGQCKILIATDVASRGLDIKNITFVINYDMPKLIENYIHRIGRTGRAGATGTSISFLTYEEDKKIGNDLVEILEESKQEVPQDLLQLKDAHKQELQRKKNIQYAKKEANKQTWDQSSNNPYKQLKDKYAYLTHGGQNNSNNNNNGQRQGGSNYYAQPPQSYSQPPQGNNWYQTGPPQPGYQGGNPPPQQQQWGGQQPYQQGGQQLPPQNGFGQF